MLWTRQSNIFFNQFYKIFKKKKDFSIRYSTNLHLFKDSISNMNKAYYRYSEGAESFDLTFIYVNSTYNVNRQFNFTRQSKETVGTLLARIRTNVDKTVSKKKHKKNKKPEEPLAVEQQEIEIKLLQNGVVIGNDILCIDVMKQNNNTQLQIIESIFEIVVNAPWITDLKLPTSILAGFPVYPTKFEGYHFIETKSQFKWFSGDDAKKNPNWKKVGDQYTYFSSNEDIGKKLKLTCIPGNNTMNGPEVETISSTNVEAGPGICPFERRHVFTTEKLSGKSFRVMSYNILADLYCDSDFTRTVLHPYCPPYALELDYRKQLYLKEILGYNCDILCLQEVDGKVFNYDLTPVLKAQSYDGIFTKKRGSVTEGLACFYNSERFRLMDSHSFILGEELSASPVFASIWSAIKDNEAFVTRISERTTAAQATVLQCIDNSEEIIVVGNTHLYFHPNADHVRLTQGGMTILWMNKIVEDLKISNPDKRITLLLCGDFNSVPSCGIYQLYTTGVAPADLEDWKSHEPEMVTGLSISQPTPLASACGTPQYTNFTAEFADCLDYIFYNREHITVTQVVPLPSVEELNQNTALPSVLFPSDHIALIADLKFNSRK